MICVERIVDKIIYYVVRTDDDNCELYSKVGTNFGGDAHNYMMSGTLEECIEKACELRKQK